MAQSILENVRGWVSDEIDRQSMGDEIGYEVLVLVTPQGPMTGLVVTLPSPVLGETLTNTLVHTGLITKPEGATELVGQAIEGLRNARSEMLRSGGGPANGSQP